MRIPAFSTLLLSVFAVAVAAQTDVLENPEVMQRETFVLVLTDGEQVVIRGDYEVQGDMVRFYLDSGGHPVYSSVDASRVDFEKTEAANEKLRAERERRKHYYQLIEERRRRILEEGQDQSVEIITGEDGQIQIRESEEAPAANEDQQALRDDFPPYSEDDLADRPESWWREEAARLFVALEQSNGRLRELSGENDRLTFAYNRARTQEEADQLQQQINTVRADFAAERNRGRLIGGRLAELSEHAEKLGVPLDWIIPTGSTIYDESGDSQTEQEAEEGEENPEVEVNDYSAEELRNVPDSWWGRERQRLLTQQNDTQSRLNDLRTKYNDLVSEKQKEQAEVRRNQLTEQIDALVDAINEQTAALEEVRRSLDRLTAAAQELGKEEALGLMRDREEQ